MRIRLSLNTFPFTFRYRLIHVAIDLLRFTVSSEQPAQNPHSPHPCDLLWHSGIGCTLLLAYARVPALPAGQGVFPASSPGMDRHRLADDQPVFDELPDLLTGVGLGDFIGLTGVQPDLLLATAEDTTGEPLPKPEHAHGCGRSSERKGSRFLADTLLSYRIPLAETLKMVINKLRELRGRCRCRSSVH